MLFLFVCAGVAAEAQNTDQGIIPYRSYINSDIDSVNPNNGNLVLHIPLVDYPQVGSLPDFTLYLRYNGYNWQDNIYPYEDCSSGNCVPNFYYQWQYTGGGVQPVRGDTMSMPQIVYDPLPDDPVYPYYYYYILDPTGATHPLADVVSGVMRTLDGTGIEFDGASVAIDKHGIKHSGDTQSFIFTDPVGSLPDNGFTDTVSDPLGNAITPILSGSIVQSWMDSANRSIPAPTYQQTAESPGCQTLTYPGPAGDGSSYKFCYISQLVQSSFSAPPGDPGSRQYSENLLLLESVTLPSGQSWQFGYDSLGNLTSLIYPTGASVTYDWNTVLTRSGVAAISQITKRTLNLNDGTPPQVWQYFYNVSQNPTVNVVTDPALNDTAYVYGAGASAQDQIVKYYAGSYANGNGVLLRQEYRQMSIGDYTQNEVFFGDANVLPTADITTLENGQTKQTTYAYDAGTTGFDGSTYPPGPGSTSPTFTVLYGSVVQQADYDYGQGTRGPLLRQTNTQYQWQANQAYLYANILDRVATKCVPTIGSSQCTQSAADTLEFTTFRYDETNTDSHGRQSPQGAYGNQTSITRWLNDGGFTQATKVYDLHGMPISERDPNENETDINYLCSDSVRYQVTNALGQMTQYGHDCASGLLTSVQDPNDLAAGRQGTGYMYDSMKNIKSVSYPDQGLVTIDYHGYANPVNATTTTTADPDSPIVRSTLYDALGRVGTQTLANTAVVVTTYDLLGRVSSVTDPHFTTDSGYGSTVYGYDALSRTKSITHSQDQSAQMWSYTGNSVDSYDETMRHWKRVSDGLGRLTTVFEPNASNSPSIETDYQYDPLGNLLSVKQLGVSGEIAHSRYFNYDSLSRLISACNPESIVTGSTCTASGPWSETYTYDSDNNVTTKTNADHVSILYCYDQLDRLLSKSSIDTACPQHQASASPYAAYIYDVPSITGFPFTSSNQIGRLFASSNDVNAGQLFAYDPMGRIAIEENIAPSSSLTGGGLYSFQAGYNKAGSLHQLTYPDGRVIGQSFDAANQLQSVAFQNYNGQAPSGYNYLSSPTYWANGAVDTMTFGNGASETHSLNSRLQPSEIKITGAPPGIAAPTLVDRSYAYAATSVCPANGEGSAQADNGNISQINDLRNSARTEVLCYDNVNRVTFASIADQTLQQSNVYDSFGNIASTSGTLSFAPAGGPNNRMLDIVHYQYDNAGNLTMANPGVPSIYTYDAENRLIGFNNGAAVYTYDAGEQRMRKDVGSDWTEYMYWDGQPLAEKHADGTWSDYIFANGERIARADNYDTRLHISGVNAQSCSGQYFSLGILALNPYTHAIQPGDILNFRQYQSGPGAIGGLALYLSNNDISYFHSVPDTDGQDLGADSTMNAWHYRTVDLTQFAGESLGFVRLINTGGAPPGQFDLYFDDISVTSPDGTVLPVFSKTPGVYVEGGIADHPECVSNFNVVDETSATLQDALTPKNTTTYYHGDQIGSARLLTSGGGWAVWSGTYTPYGQEINPAQINPPNFYKFIGKHRDEDEGSYLDYFGARYYASSMGRFMSPDTGADAVMGVPVPYADLTNPQSLNLYSYVGNNPLTRTDPDGHDYTICIPGQPCTHLTDQQYQDAIHGQGNNGINAPAFGQSGNITCGGVACGSATYMDQGAVNDLSGGQLMGLAGGKALEGVMGIVGKAIGQMLGRGAGELAGDAAAGGAKVLLQGGTKQAAKAVVDGLADSAQKATLKRAIARATISESVSIKELADGSLQVVKSRPGFDGSQSITTTIGADGSSTTVQTAVDASGAQVHYDPKN